MFPGEVAFIGYSDGSVEIELTDTDTHSIKNLSKYEQEILHKLYAPRIDHGMMQYQKTIPYREWAEFQKIFSHEKKRENVKRYYNLQVEGVQPPDFKKAAIFGTTGIALYLGFWGVMTFKREMRYHIQNPRFYKMPSCTWSNIIVLKPFCIALNKLWTGR